MLLRIYAPGHQPRSVPSGLTLEREAGQLDSGIEYDQYYPLDDEHKFIVRSAINGRVIIEIRRGKRQVQQATLHALSYVTDYDDLGQPIVLPHVFDLRPDESIYPISKLVDQLLSEGVEPWEITRKFNIFPDGYAAGQHYNGGGILDTVEPYMISDGQVTSRESTLDNTVRALSVKGATWAIQATKHGVHHIYLWDGAAECAADVLEAVREIWASKAPLGQIA